MGTELVSRGTGFAGAAADDSTDSVTIPAVSSNGRYVAFQSRATNFDPADTDSVYDIYLRDTQAGTTTLVSRADGAAGAKGIANSDSPAISADGRYIAFSSISNNLHPGDLDSLSDVFVRDTQLNTTTLVPRGDASNFGTTPSISADGRLIAFDSQHAIYVRDMQAGTTILVSRASGASGAPGSSNSFSPSISPSGRYVAYESQSTNLDPADASPDTDIYVRDTAAGTTVLASRASGAGGVKAGNDSGEPSMSDAPSVAFESIATNLHPDDTGPSGFDIFVRDLAVNTTTLVSRANGAAGAKGNNSSRWPSISANGARVAFESGASNLVAADGDGTSDIFARDLVVGSTTLASVASDGTKGNNSSQLAALSPDGGFVAFESAASNLGVTATARQIFIRALGSAAPSAGTFFPVAPARIFDTRTGTGTALGRIGPAGQRVLDVTGTGGVPPSGVTAVVVNLTLTEGTTNTFLSVTPDGGAATSNLNTVAGETRANLVKVAVGADSNIRVFNAAGDAHVVMDVLGYYSDGPADGSRFNPVVPTRITDTRAGTGATGKLGAGTASERIVDVTGVGGVPAAGVTAVVLNTTVTEGTAPSFLAVTPNGGASTSNINFGGNQDVANLVVAQVGSDGNVRVNNGAGQVHFILDVVGWYGDAGAPTGDLFTPVLPQRILDTRASGLGTFTPAGKLGAGAANQKTVTVTGMGGVAVTGVTAVVVNVTGTEGTANTFLSVTPGGGATTSSLNLPAGQDKAGLVVVPVDATGNVKVFNAVGQVHVLFDVVGYFASS